MYPYESPEWQFIQKTKHSRLQISTGMAPNIALTLQFSQHSLSDSHFSYVCIRNGDYCSLSDFIQFFCASRFSITVLKYLLKKVGFVLCYQNSLDVWNRKSLPHVSITGTPCNIQGILIETWRRIYVLRKLLNWNFISRYHAIYITIKTWSWGTLFFDSDRHSDTN